MAVEDEGFKDPDLALYPSYVQDGMPIYHVKTKRGMVEVRWHTYLSRDELKDLIWPFLQSSARRAAGGAHWI